MRAGGGGLKGRLEFFRKFIQIWESDPPLCRLDTHHSLKIYPTILLNGFALDQLLGEFGNFGDATDRASWFE